MMNVIICLVIFSCACLGMMKLEPVNVVCLEA